MASKNKKIKTWHQSGDKYGGDFCELPVADLATNRQVIQACYYEKQMQDQLKCREVCVNVAQKLRRKWSEANPNIIQLGEKVVINKVEKLYKKAVEINSKKAKATVKEQLDKRLDRLFDLACCNCDLPIVSCQDVRCKTPDCVRIHIHCNCPRAVQVS